MGLQAGASGATRGRHRASRGPTLPTRDPAPDVSLDGILEQAKTLANARAPAAERHAVMRPVAPRFKVLAAVLAGLMVGCGSGPRVAPSTSAFPSASSTPQTSEAPASPSPMIGMTASPPPSSAPAADPTARATAEPTPIAVEIEHGPRDRRVVALTFDADMTEGMLAQLRSSAVASWYDARIVDELRSAGISATVFLTGLWAETYPDVVRSLAADPSFELENHSMDHAAWHAPCFGLPALSTEAAKRKELTEAADIIRSTAGMAPTYFRFPGGCRTAADVAFVAALGEQPLGWDVTSGDAFQGDADVIVRTVLSRVRPGSIIVMHLVGAPNAPATAMALERLIPLLQAKGYDFVTVRDLLAAPVRP